jgi:DNA processing protein
MSHPLRVWTPDDADYPYRLQSCPDKPNPLYVRGNVPPAGGHVVAIVGTRKPTERGKELTETLVHELHERLDDLIIVSGGAYGIDIAAHRAALKYGVPTIMVLAHGLDRIYPSQHRPEAEASMENGGVVSEYEIGTEPFAANFLQRNRIIAGMADAVVIVESREKGGSLCTAQRAFEYDRALFAFPGRPNDISARGCNELIRKGYAQLIDGAEDLIRTMGWKTKQEKAGGVQTSLIGLMDDLTPAQQTLLTQLDAAEEGLHINVLVQQSGMEYGEVSSELTMLELQGLVRSLPGGIYRFVR